LSSEPARLIQLLTSRSKLVLDGVNCQIT